MGMGMGLMMPALFTHDLARDVNASTRPCIATTTCSDCQGVIPADARFCHLCGHQQVILSQCANCGKNLALNAKFCSRCGHPTTEQPKIVLCPYCKTENLPGAMYCNQCGQRIE
jgi:predicted amidophosphoribosyltransferase